MDMQESNGTTPNGSNVGLLGDYLKQKRIEKNYSLEKLSQKTKISINILKALEVNDYKNLPSAPYIKGFVISYVKVLGLPQEEAINKMEYTYLNVLGKAFPALNHTKSRGHQPEPTPVEASSEGTQNPHEVIENGESIIDSTKSFLPIVIFAVVILLFVGGYKIITTVVEKEVTDTKAKDLGPKIEPSSALIKKPVEEPKKAEEKPAESPATAATPEQPGATPAPATPEEKTVEVKEEPELQRNFPTVDFKKIRGKLFNVTTDAPENTDETILPKQIKDSMNSQLQNIYIKAVDGNTWLSYKIDNNPIESVILNKDNDLFLQGHEIRLFLGNVNVTKIFYNNYLIDTPTKTGVKSLVFPEESNAKFQLPLFPKAKDDLLYTSEDYIKRMKLEEEEIQKRKQSE